jgi:hypothetical protein
MPTNKREDESADGGRGLGSRAVVEKDDTLQEVKKLGDNEAKLPGYQQSTQPDLSLTVLVCVLEN